MDTASKTTIKVDVMRQLTRTQERYVCTLRYPHLECFRINPIHLYQFVIRHRSDLRNEVITLYPGTGSESVTFYPRKDNQ